MLEILVKKKLSNFTLEVDIEEDFSSIALLGASGSGKSVTLRMLIGSETPTSGRIALNGQDLFNSEKNINIPLEKRNIGMLFQDFKLFPNMNVKNNIKIALKNNEKFKNCKKDDLECEIDRILKFFSIDHLKNHDVLHLSGGEKQRVALARLQASNPKLILLDEPTSQLDEHLKFDLGLELKYYLQKLNIPYIIVTHDMREALRLADKIMVIENHTIKGTIKSEDIYNSIHSVTMARLLGIQNIFDTSELKLTDIFSEQFIAFSMKNAVLDFSSEVCNNKEIDGFFSVNEKIYFVTKLIDIVNSQQGEVAICEFRNKKIKVLFKDFDIITHNIDDLKGQKVLVELSLEKVLELKC